MSHVESAGQAVARVKYSAERRERTVAKANGDPAKIRRADFHHLRTVRNTRRQVRYNGAIPRLERSILGTTGSPETLERFRQLAKEIGEKAGQPVVVVEAVEESGNQLRQALVGDLTGAMHVRDSFSYGASVIRSKVKSPRLSASVLAGTEPLIQVTRDEDHWKIKRAGQPGDAFHVQVAKIELNESGDTTDPEEDFTVHDMGESNVLLGEEAIRASELFEPDLKTVLFLTGTVL